jgi:hypothetical protein
MLQPLREGLPSVRRKGCVPAACPAGAHRGDGNIHPDGWCANEVTGETINRYAQLPLLSELDAGRRRKAAGPLKVLLVEPEYKAKYPPLGLMKISSFHKARGDEVVFHKGTRAAVRDAGWDLIYIATMFTYQWRCVTETIRFYQRQKGAARIVVGGILASLLPHELEAETGIKPHVGLWDDVDRLHPDYSLFDASGQYSIGHASIAYTTRGCIRRCPFCAVPRLEPNFVPYIPLAPQIDSSKKDLILLDNNVLASPEFSSIVDDIRKAGFERGARLNGRLRHVDFNQGVDARLLNEDHMRLFSTIAIHPLRIAFDHVDLRDTYVRKIRLAHKYGIRRLSNYVLYNFDDTPEDFYQRLRINVELNEELGLSIFSFPMRYVPLDARERGYVDNPHWTKQQLRGVQCILHATRGVVGPRMRFFEKAFGKNEDEFKHIIERPEHEIFHREHMIPFAGLPR